MKAAPAELDGALHRSPTADLEGITQKTLAVSCNRTADVIRFVPGGEPPEFFISTKPRRVLPWHE